MSLPWPILHSCNGTSPQDYQNWCKELHCSTIHRYMQNYTLYNIKILTPTRFTSLTIKWWDKKLALLCHKAAFYSHIPLHPNLSFFIPFCSRWLFHQPIPSPITSHTITHSSDIVFQASATTFGECTTFLELKVRSASIDGHWLISHSF